MATAPLNSCTDSYTCLVVPNNSVDSMLQQVDERIEKALQELEQISSYASSNNLQRQVAKNRYDASTVQGAQNIAEVSKNTLNSPIDTLRSKTHSTSYKILEPLVYCH